MEAYRKKIKGRAVAGCILAGALLLLFVAAKLTGLLPVAEDAHHDYLLGFQYGALGGVEAYMIVRIISRFLLLRSDEKLEKQRIREEDERSREIALRSGRATVTVTLIAMEVALLVSASFSYATTMVLTVVAISYILVYAGITFYYSRKL